MVCMGTRFIATRGSGVVPGHKQMLSDASLGDVFWTDAICGIPANFLRPSIVANGLDPDHLPPLTPTGKPSIPQEVKPWSMVWSGGHSAALVVAVPSVAELVVDLEQHYVAAKRLWNA